MRVGIDASSIVGDRGGVGWHTYHLLKALIGLNEGVEFVGYVNPGSLRNGVPQGWDGGQGIRWIEAGRLMMRWRGRLDGLDLYHGTNFKMRTTGRCGGIVTIHDLWLERHPEYSPKLFGQRASSARTRREARRARTVITVSEFSAGEIASCYGIPRERIAVIYNGVADDFRTSSDVQAWSKLRARIGLPTDRFILFVGGADPRKNHRLLLKAYTAREARLKEYCLVLVGDPHHRFGSMPETIRALGLADRAICTDRLPIETIRLLYAHASLFVFPSLYEGFGMPVLEAMACGAPVVTSNRTALPEVAGDAAVLVNPDNDEELAEAMVLVLEDAGRRERLKAKGLERVKQFTWERAARQTLEVYREVCALRGN